VVQGRQRLEHHPQEARQLSTPASPADEHSTRPAAPPAKGQLLGLDHVQLAMPAGAEAEQDAERFYGEVLGLRRVPKPPALALRGGCWFEGACVKIHLGVEEPFHPARKAHPALLVENLDLLAQRIVDAGGEVAPADDVPGVHRVHTHDPFGNRIELVETDVPTPEMFSALANHSIYPISMLDENGIVRWAGDSIERFFGHKPDDIIGHRFDKIVAPESIGAAFEAFASINDAFEPTPWGGVGLPVDMLHADGSVVACDVAAITTKRTGLPWYIVMMRQAGYERALDQAVEAMAAGATLGDVLALVVAAVERMVPETGVAVADRWTGERFAVSAGRAASLLAVQPGAPWARAMLTGDDQFVIDRNDLPGPLAALARAEGYEACWVHPVALSADEQAVAAIIVWRTYPGPPTRFTWNTMRKAGQLLRLVLQWDRSHRTLEFAATHDPLTGLANRQAFRDRVTAVAKAGEGRASVLYLDLDRFKPVNDLLGHHMGDRALVVVAERLIGALRPGDMVARMGGDEFAVLCERLASVDDVERVAARLLDVIRQPIATTAVRDDIQLDASIGITDVHPGEMVDAILARADDAMRSAKHTGRGRWVRPGA
jgi:diguanylate cyclase (GGDEF)-like protein/PAS domain S-box-containing protein